MAAKSTTRKAAPKRTYTAKAVDMGISDEALLVGTIAADGSKRLADSEQYYYLFRKHPWVRACVRIIANAVAQEGFAVSTVDGEDVEDDDPRVAGIHQFFRKAFAPKTPRQAFKAIAADLQIYGWAFWRKKYTGKLLTNLERLDPRTIQPKLNSDRTAIEAFEVKRNRLATAGVLVETGADGAPIPADEVVMFSLDEGGDVVLGSPSPLEALDLTTAMDLNIRKHRNAFFKNAATTGNVLINKEANEEAIRSAEKQLLSMKVGAGSAYKNLILPGDWEVKSLLQSGKNDVDFIKGSDQVRDEVCAVYSVPVSKLLSISGAMGQAGKGEDDETFEQECVLPVEELIYETVTMQILHAELDLPDLQLVPRRRNAVRADRFDDAIKMVKFGASGNQALDHVGLPQSDDPGMNIPLFLGATAGNVAQDEPAAHPAQPAQSGAALNQSNDAIDANEVAQKANSRFRY